MDPGADDASDEEAGRPAFRAIDLLETSSFKSKMLSADIPANVSSGSQAFNLDFRDTESERPPDSLADFELVAESGQHELGYIETISDDDGQTAETGAALTEVSGSCTVESTVWNHLVSSQFSQYRDQYQGMQYPWEQGVFSQIFEGPGDLVFPKCSGLAELGAVPSTGEAGETALNLPESLPIDAKYLSVISSTKDLDYFETKHQKLELACGQWLELLSISWKAFGVGDKVADALHSDSSGQSAMEILYACFGIKSPSTLLKRAGSFRQFVRWYDKSGHGVRTMSDPFPIRESTVWEYFLWLRDCRREHNKGFTLAASFLETVRFAKFTVELKDADSVISSRRLLGFAAIEKKCQGPTRQAPGLELEHVRRLHEILSSESNDIDRLAAGCFLICLYGRARWSDVRFIDHAVVEKGRHGSLTLFTTEHKTSSVGARREQYLPLVIPWEGVTSEPWMDVFLSLYEKVGLDINKSPLGPLLPAPRANGSFCARPVSTAEAAKWLRALLSGTTNSESYRSHSLKATVLIWCARAGFDRETRAVLGHHCSAVTGSDVVYSRHLQTRALRKLSMLLRRLRIGLGFEDDNMREMGVVSTPVPMTPAGLITPVINQPKPVVSIGDTPGPTIKEVMDSAIQCMNEVEELESVKHELDDLSGVAESAGEIALFDLSHVTNGVIQLDSSSGSSSDDTTSSEESEQEIADNSIIRDFPHFEEAVPEGFDFYRYVKSCIVHSCKAGSRISKCKVQMSEKFRLLDRTMRVKFPKCLRCFPKDHNRLRSIEDLTTAVDQATKRVRRGG